MYKAQAEKHRAVSTDTDINTQSPVRAISLVIFMGGYMFRKLFYFTFIETTLSKNFAAEAAKGTFHYPPKEFAHALVVKNRQSYPQLDARPFWKRPHPMVMICSILVDLAHKMPVEDKSYFSVSSIAFRAVHEAILNSSRYKFSNQDWMFFEAVLRTLSDTWKILSPNLLAYYGAEAQEDYATFYNEIIRFIHRSDIYDDETLTTLI